MRFILSVIELPFTLPVSHASTYATFSPVGLCYFSATFHSMYELGLVVLCKRRIADTIHTMVAPDRKSVV